MEKAVLVEAEVQDHSQHWHRLQVRPHRALDGHTDGAILSLVDIQDLRSDVATAEWARDYASSIVEAVQVPLVVLGDGPPRPLGQSGLLPPLPGELPHDRGAGIL